MLIARNKYVYLGYSKLLRKTENGKLKTVSLEWRGERDSNPRRTY